MAKALDDRQMLLLVLVAEIGQVRKARSLTELLPGLGINRGRAVAAADNLVKQGLLAWASPPGTDLVALTTRGIQVARETKVD